MANDLETLNTLVTALAILQMPSILQGLLWALGLVWRAGVNVYRLVRAPVAVLSDQEEARDIFVHPSVVTIRTTREVDGQPETTIQELHWRSSEGPSSQRVVEVLKSFLEAKSSPASIPVQVLAYEYILAASKQVKSGDQRSEDAMHCPRAEAERPSRIPNGAPGVGEVEERGGSAETEEVDLGTMVVRECQVMKRPSPGGGLRADEASGQMRPSPEAASSGGGLQSSPTTPLHKHFTT